MPRAGRIEQSDDHLRLQGEPWRRGLSDVYGRRGTGSGPFRLKCA